MCSAAGGHILICHLSNALRASDSTAVHPPSVWLAPSLLGCLALSFQLNPSKVVSNVRLEGASTLLESCVSPLEVSFGEERMVGNQPAAVGPKTTLSRRSAVDSVAPVTLAQSPVDCRAGWRLVTRLQRSR